MTKKSGQEPEPGRLDGKKRGSAEPTTVMEK